MVGWRPIMGRTRKTPFDTVFATIGLQ